MAATKPTRDTNCSVGGRQVNRRYLCGFDPIRGTNLAKKNKILRVCNAELRFFALLGMADAFNF
ncbi:MAG: hypothetical protein ACREFR_10970, partial [Limisphaerales bacterium]